MMIKGHVRNQKFKFVPEDSFAKNLIVKHFVEHRIAALIVLVSLAYKSFH